MAPQNTDHSRVKSSNWQEGRHIPFHVTKEKMFSPSKKSLSLFLKFRIIRFTVMVTKSSTEDPEGSVNLQKFFLVHLLGWDLLLCWVSRLLF